MTSSVRLCLPSSSTDGRSDCVDEARGSFEFHDEIPIGVSQARPFGAPGSWRDERPECGEGVLSAMTSEQQSGGGANQNRGTGSGPGLADGGRLQQPATTDRNADLAPAVGDEIIRIPGSTSWCFSSQTSSLRKGACCRGR